MNRPPDDPTIQYGNSAVPESRPRRRITSRRAERRRTRPSPQRPLQIAVPFPIPPKVRAKLSRDWIARVSTRALVQHLLYARGVAPAPARELLRIHCGASEKRLSSVERKFARCGASLERLLKELDVLFTAEELSLLHFSQVLISIGPSWSRPKELYVLDVSSINADQDPSGSAPPEISQEHAFSRRLVGALLRALNPIDDGEGATADSNQSDQGQVLLHPSPSNASYKVFLSVRVKKVELERVFASVSVDMRNELSMSPARMLLEHVALHQALTSATYDRAGPHCVSIQASETEICSRRSDEDDSSSTEVWMTLPTSIMGFRL